jgi:hypothetical protein
MNRLDIIMLSIRWGAMYFPPLVFAVGDGQVPVLIKQADVTGVKPAVFTEGCAIELGAVVVSPRNRVTSHQDLAIGRDFDLDSLDDPPDSPDPIILLGIGRNSG